MNKHSLNYYFLNKYIRLDEPQGFRHTLINVLINDNPRSKGEFLLIQEKVGFWGFPRQGIVAQNLVENYFETVIRNLGDDLGFAGTKVIDAQPKFTPKACVFNIDKQIFSKNRYEAEVKKGRRFKGKVYHLALTGYKGPNKLPIDLSSSKCKIKDYKWVSKQGGKILTTMDNYELAESQKDVSKKTMEFHKHFFNRIIDLVYTLNNTFDEDSSVQGSLFTS